MEMGMIGSTGRKAIAESCRRNANIKAIQKSLNVDNKTLNKLVQKAKDEGWFN
jgi:transposase